MSSTPTSRTADDRPLIFACVAMIAFGVWLRLQNLGFPHAMTWDEYHFVNAARAYLSGHRDLNDHPPLGKLLIALPMLLFGDRSFAWRLAPALFGGLAIGLAAWLAAWTTKRRTAGWMAAALLAVDGFFICYSRCALLDGMLACFLLAAVVLAVRFQSPLGIAAASLLVGSACSLKISGMVVLPLLAWAAVSGRAPVKSLLTLLLAPVAFVAWFSLGLSLTHRPAGVLAVFAKEKRLFLHHLGLTHWKNPWCSHWYQWFLPTRPVTMRDSAGAGGLVRVLSSMGNPLLWWLVDLAVLVTAVGLVKVAIDRLRKRGFSLRLAELRALLDTRPGRYAALLLAWFLPIFPWIATHRDSYIYHYLPAYGFGIVLVAALLDELYSKLRLAALGLLMAVAVVSGYYAPIWGQLPVTPAGVERRLFIRSWR